MKLDQLRAGSMEQHALEMIRQRFIRSFKILAVMLRHCAQRAFVINDHPLAAAAPRQNRPLLERFLRVGDDQPFVENHLLPQAVANRTGSQRRVEGKMLRRERIERPARGGTVQPV